MNTNHSPKITVVITTKDRGDAVCAALKSILSNDFGDYKVVVVDQSSDNSTEQAVSMYLSNSDFRYIRSVLTGSSAGRNLAIENTDTELIAITDDDCEVSENWLESMVRAFVQDENIGIVYGKVEPGKSVDNTGFITTYIEENSYTSKSLYDEKSLRGLSANMGIRKTVWEKLNGFDPVLGAGVHFNSCEETDLNIRTLLKGYFIHYSPEVSVMHHGYRDSREAQRLVEGYAYGNGALFAKHIKSGQFGMIFLLFTQILSWAFGTSWVMTNTNTESYKFGRMRAFIRGLLKGFTTPLDKSKGHFMSRA